MLVNFDWGGEVGEAYYRALELNPEILEGHGRT
jgi:hypothetical protein